MLATGKLERHQDLFFFLGIKELGGVGCFLCRSTQEMSEVWNMWSLIIQPGLHSWRPSGPNLDPNDIWGNKAVQVGPPVVQKAKQKLQHPYLPDLPSVPAQENVMTSLQMLQMRVQDPRGLQLMTLTHSVRGLAGKATRELPHIYLVAFDEKGIAPQLSKKKHSMSGS